MRRWSWVGVLVVGFVLFEFVRRALISTQNPNLVPSLILLGAAVVPAAFVAFVYGLRLDFGVGGGTLALVALVGGVVGTVTAGLLEYDTLRTLGVLPMVAVGLIEEAVKLIGPVAVVLLTRHRHRADGLLIGVASGAGFAALETMGYGFVTLIQSNGDVSAVEGVLLLRGILSPAAHMAWTGLSAAALWEAARRGWHPGALARFGLVYALVVALHATWDSVGDTAVYAVLAAISLGLLTLTAFRLGRRQQVPVIAPTPESRFAAG
jgi:protease PrsW